MPPALPTGYGGRPGRLLTAAVAATLVMPSASVAQLPLPDPTALAMGDMVAATATGFGSVAGNPAGLAWSARQDRSLTFLPVRVGSGMGPVGLGDLAEWEGRTVPRSVREEWLRRIEDEGRQEGRALAEVSGVAGSVGRVGFQLSTVAVGAARLNPDAAELLLFGNAGRTGEARPLELAGSRVDAAIHTTAAIAYGRPVAEIGGGRLAVGATASFTAGHVLVAGRDAGSSLASDPFLVDVRFPLLTAPGEGRPFVAGRGVGLDLGARWRREGLELGATVGNAVSTFDWKLDRLVFRPGRALFDDDSSEGDFDERPGEEAPTLLRDAAKELGFVPELELGAAWSVRDGTELVVGIRSRHGEGLSPGADHRGAIAIRRRLTDVWELAGHLAGSDRGGGLGAGATLLLGSLRISGAGAYRGGGVDAGYTWSIGAAWGSAGG